MKSMTGFGIAEYSDANESFSVELKSVNHRYKDFSFRLSRKVSPLEDNIRKYLSARLSRGHVDVSIKYTAFKDKAVSLRYDANCAAAYKDILDTMAKQFPDINNEVTLCELSHYTGVIISEESIEDLTLLFDRLLVVLSKACDMLEESRSNEGEALKMDFLARIDTLEEYISKIYELSEEVPKLYYENLKNNISEYINETIDEQRLLTELALYADKCNITEELVRLSAHLKNFRKILLENEPIGRKLDFLVQEINREVNTIASKSNNYDISTIVVETKAEIEKIREQVQNIE